MLIRLLLLSVLTSLSVSGWGQKNEETEGIPAMSETFEFYSVFELKDGKYTYKETHKVWTPTFLRTNPKKSEIILPGIGNEQKCFYTLETCSFVEDENVIQVVIVPIECIAVGGESEKRDLRIHYIRKKRKIEYIFSLDITGTSSRILMHNYSYQKLTELITNREIRFQ